ncbi:MAG: hypothetical protein HYY30_11685 [Chloroflexi bacterium]|nr:hypothetical protein [Chloroflexota bacterium]
MRWLTLLLVGVMAVSGCAASTSTSTSAPTSASTSAPASKSTNVEPPAKPANEAAVSSASDRPAPSIVEGIRVTVDGQTLDIPGDVKVSRERGSGVEILYIGRNPRPSALVGGNGVLLEISPTSQKDGFQEGMSASDVAVVTFTVWKGVEFSYVSTGAISGQPLKGLVISQKSGKLSGSFEADLNGTLGKLRARVDFGVVLPK